jgi:heme A synthase
MKLNAFKLLQIALWVTCVFHVFVGLSLNLDIGLKEWVGSVLYSAQVDWSQPQFVYILKPMGAFMFILGIMAAIAARDPLHNKWIVYSFALLWLIRTLQRILFISEIQNAFQIPMGGLVSGTVFVFLSGALLVVLLYFADRPQQPAPGMART